MLAQLIPGRLDEFKSLYGGDPKRKTVDNLSFTIRDWLLGLRAKVNFGGNGIRRSVMRVAAGGHDVPEADVRRRFHRGLSLFEQVYKPLVDEWYHWYSDEGGLRLGQYQER